MKLGARPGLAPVLRAPAARTRPLARGRCALVTLLCCLPWAGGCGAASAGDACVESAAILGSTVASNASGAGLESDVGYLRVEADVEASPSRTVTLTRICSVARIAPGLALSAAHCVDDLLSFRAEVGFGAAVPAPDPSGCHSSLAGAVTAVSRGTGDLMAVRFEDANDAPGLTIHTAPIAVGTAVLLAGYGVAEQGIGVRLFADAVVTGVGDATYLVEVPGGGACTGDSGGPMLVRDPTGRFEVGGVLWRGSLSCRGQDEYTSTSGVSIDVDDF